MKQEFVILSDKFFYGSCCGFGRTGLPGFEDDAVVMCDAYGSRTHVAGMSRPRLCRDVDVPTMS